eukprot:scaffold39401_cov19-Tisochrysis_lutea.AAC.2
MGCITGIHLAQDRKHYLTTPIPSSGALQAARYSKKGSREAEIGVLAVDALHKQVMPFILRRTKAQVRACVRVRARVCSCVCHLSCSTLRRKCSGFKGVKVVQWMEG